MNIFVLDECPVRAAHYQCDKHVVKMPLETAQILSTNLHLHHVDAPYRATHKNHPCTVWARSSQENCRWLLVHGLALCLEYTARYGRTHKSQRVVEWAASYIDCFPAGSRTPWPQAMPDEHRGDCTVTAYRNYYRHEKAKIATWRCELPLWWKNDKPAVSELT